MVSTPMYLVLGLAFNLGFLFFAAVSRLVTFPAAVMALSSELSTFPGHITTFLDISKVVEDASATGFGNLGGLLVLPSEPLFFHPLDKLNERFVLLISGQRYELVHVSVL